MPKLRVEAEIGANITPLERAFAKAKGLGVSFAGSLKGNLAAAFSVAAVTGFVRAVVNNVTAIKDMAEQAQVTTDEAQKMRFAAIQSGQGFEKFAELLAKVGPVRQAAAEGNEDLMRSLNKLGIAAEDTVDPLLSDLDILKKIGGAVGGIDGNAFKDLFGNRAAKMMAVVQDFHAMGPIELVSPDTLDRVDKAEKKLKQAWNNLLGAAAVPLAASLDYAEPIGQAFKEQASFLMPTEENSLILHLMKKMGLYESRVTPRLDQHTQTPVGPMVTVAEAPLFDLDKKERLAVAEAEKELYEATAKLDFARLDTAGKRLQLERKIVSLGNSALGPVTEVGRLDILRQQKEAQMELLNLREETPEKQRVDHSISSDALGRIGGVLNGSGRNPQLQDQLSELKRLVQASQEQIRILRGGI